MLNKCSEPGPENPPAAAAEERLPAVRDPPLIFIFFQSRVACYGGDADGIYLSLVKRKEGGPCVPPLS